MSEIKMGTKEPIRINVGLSTPTVVTTKTGTTTNVAPGIKVSSLGMENHITDAKPKKQALIEIDNIQLAQLIEKCVEDLKTPRIFTIKGTPTQVEFISKFDARLTSIFFNFEVRELNNMIGLNEETLADFFSSFFYTNLNKYSIELFNGIPILLPIMTIETLSEKGVRVLYH